MPQSKPAERRPLTDDELRRLEHAEAGETIAKHHERPSAEQVSWGRTLRELPSRSSIIFSQLETTDGLGSSGEVSTESMEAMEGFTREQFPPTLEGEAFPDEPTTTRDSPSGTTSRRTLGELSRRTVTSLDDLKEDPGELPTEQIDAFEDVADAGKETVAASPKPPKRASTTNSMLASDADFVLESMIGRGGQGEVWLAWQASLQRQVAVKCLRSGDIAEFLQEAYTSGELDHPNIVPIYDLGRIIQDDKEQPLLAMKRVRGHPWNELLDRDRNEPELSFEAYLLRHLRIFVDVCNAVAYAHSKGIIHRDLKPSQVMVGEFGEVFLMDWGLAVCINDDVPLITHNRLPKHSTLKTASNRCGSPAYMAPEQTLDSTTALGTHTDIYLLGSVLFEIVSGRPPHAAENAEGAYYMAVLNEFGELPEQTPPEMRELIDRALQTDPVLRPESAAEFRDALDDYMSGAGKQRDSREIVVEVLAMFAATPLEEMDYEQITQCSQRLTRALQLWPENPDAEQIRQRVVVRHASLAIDGGDLKLAEVLADGIDDNKERTEMKMKIEEERAKLEEHRRQRRFLFGACLALSLLSMIAISLYFVRESYVTTRRAEEEQKIMTAQLRTQLYQDRTRQGLKELEKNQELFERALALQSAEVQLAREFERTMPMPERLTPELDSMPEPDPAHDLQVESLLQRRENVAKQRAQLAEEDADLYFEPFELLIGEANHLLDRDPTPENIQRAYELYSRANEQLPSFPEPLMGMGIAAARQGDFAAAVKHLQGASVISRAAYGDRDIFYARALSLEAEARERADAGDPRIRELRRQALGILKPHWSELAGLIADQYETIGDDDRAADFRDAGGMMPEGKSGTPE